MLELTVGGEEYWNEKLEKFVYGKEVTLKLEHSLLSLSKWEQKWHKPFLQSIGKQGELSAEQIFDYIKCMTINTVEDEVYTRMSEKNIKEIMDYINDPCSALNYKSMQSGKRGNVQGKLMTNETIYYWMICFGIPFSCEKWHLNHLLALISWCSEEEKPKKKMSKHDLWAQNSALNAARKAGRPHL